MYSPKVNLIGKISHFFAVNRPLSVLVLITALLLGLVSFALTPKQYNPEIIRPAFSVSITYDGATIEGAVDRVVYELVEKINTVPGVDDVYTEVHDGATINTTVIFEVGYDATKAKLDLLTQLQQHSYLARGNISQPSVREINPETIPVLQVVFGSDSLSVSELREKVVALSHQMGGVDEVSELEVYGGYQTALVIEADPNLLSANNVSVENLLDTLRQSQVREVSSGSRSEPFRLEMVFDNIAASADSVGGLFVADGVQVRDVARVYEGPGSSRSYVFYEDRESKGEVVLLSVSKVEGSSAPQVTKEFLAVLGNSLQQPAFSNLNYEVVSNDGATAETEILGLTKNLVTSIAIVAMVLLLFLSTRAALVVLIAIPTTLLIVFGLGLLFDQTINRITLFALILSLGLLVDSAIVVVENIYSHLKQWQGESEEVTREHIIARAVDEIGVGLLLSTVTSVIVFLPMNYITGMMGPYMGPIAFFVPAALIVSLLVAVVVVPFVAAHLLHVDDKPSKLTKAFSLVVQRVTSAYVKFLRSILYNAQKQKTILLSALGLLIISLVLPATGLVHFQMLPRADRDQFYVYVDLPVGTDQEETRRVTEKVSETLLLDVDVVNIQQFVATPPIVDFNGLFKGAQNRGQSRQSTIRVNLTRSGDRNRSSTDVVTAVRESLATENESITSAVRFMEEPPGPPVRATFVAKVSASNPLVQRTAAEAFNAFIPEVEGVVDTYLSDEQIIGRARYTFDTTAAEALGVRPASVLTVLQMMSGSYEVTEFLGADTPEYTPIVLKVAPEYRVSPAVIDTLTVVNQTGAVVPLRSVLKVEYEPRPSQVSFEDAQSVTYVTAEVQDRSIVYVVIELMRSLINGDFKGYTVTDWNLWGMTLEADGGEVVQLTWGGEWEMTLENFRDLGVAMGMALLMVYGILVAQYNRFSTPAYILVTVPLGLVGILWGFLILDSGFGIYLTATALIGFIALIGLVVNNAIIFLEYVEQAKDSGLSYRESLLAAGEARLRPIFLTSLTTVLGSLTIVSDPVWSGLAWAIVFGLSLSTILTLVVYPTLLVYFGADEKDLKV